MDLLRELHRGGATICMVTHDPRFTRYAERTVHLFDGRVVDESAEKPTRAAARRGRRMSLRDDLRHGLRGLAADRSWTAVAVMTVALGIGANAAIFAVVDAALLRPLPFAEPDRLVAVWGAGGGQRSPATAHVLPGLPRLPADGHALLRGLRRLPAQPAHPDRPGPGTGPGRCGGRLPRVLPAPAGGAPGGPGLHAGRGPRGRPGRCPALREPVARAMGGAQPGGRDDHAGGRAAHRGRRDAGVLPLPRRRAAVDARRSSPAERVPRDARQSRAGPTAAGGSAGGGGRGAAPGGGPARHRLRGRQRGAQHARGAAAAVAGGRGAARRSSCSSARWCSCSSSPARTSPRCSWPAPAGARARWRCGSASAPPAAAWSASC